MRASGGKIHREAGMSAMADGRVKGRFRGRSPVASAPGFSGACLAAHSGGEQCSQHAHDLLGICDSRRGVALCRRGRVPIV
jgi:hypothetical protein